MRKEPEFDVAVLRSKLVIAFAHLAPAPLLDPLLEMIGGDDGDLDFCRDPEHPERQPLRLIEVRFGRGVAPARRTVGANQTKTARHRR